MTAGKSNAQAATHPVGATRGLFRAVLAGPGYSMADAFAIVEHAARVLEIATPRWSTLLALRNGLPPTTLAPATIQEHAWSSPIWYTPALRALSSRHRP